MSELIREIIKTINKIEHLVELLRVDSETPMCQVGLHLIYTGIRETANSSQRWVEDTFPPLVLELIIHLNKLKSQIKQLTQSDI